MQAPTGRCPVCGRDVIEVRDGTRRLVLDADAPVYVAETHGGQVTWHQMTGRVVLAEHAAVCRGVA